MVLHLTTNGLSLLGKMESSAFRLGEVIGISSLNCIDHLYFFLIRLFLFIAMIFHTWRPHCSFQPCFSCPSPSPFRIPLVSPSLISFFPHTVYISYWSITIIKQHDHLKREGLIWTKGSRRIRVSHYHCKVARQLTGMMVEVGSREKASWIADMQIEKPGNDGGLLLWKPTPCWRA